MSPFPCEKCSGRRRRHAIHVDRFMMQLIRKYKFLKACQFNIKFIMVDNNLNIGPELVIKV